MNGYLVVISSSMDDVPVRLCESESFAREFAATCDPEKEANVVAEQRFIDVAGDLINIRLQRFVDGASVSDEIVRDLEDVGDCVRTGACRPEACVPVWRPGLRRGDAGCWKGGWVMLEITVFVICASIVGFLLRGVRVDAGRAGTILIDWITERIWKGGA